MIANRITRRRFLALSGAVGLTGAGQVLFPRRGPRLAFRAPAQKAQGDVLVCLFLRGGMDGLSVVVPYAEGAHYYDARPTQAVPEPGQGEGAALDLDGRFGLHPALAPLKEIYDEGDLAFVHACGSPHPTRSHFDAMMYMEYGTPGDKTTGSGWLGRHLAATAGRSDSAFRAVSMGTMPPDSLRGPVPALSLQSIADFRLMGREDELAHLRQSLGQLYGVQAPTDALGRQAALVFETVDQLQALDANDDEPASGAEYPAAEEYGAALRQIARLIKADVGLEAACLDLDGWDTHENQGTLDGEFHDRLDILARGLHAFYTDLGERMDRVTLVAMSEFGRRVEENGSRGTDHGHGNVMLLLGGGIAGGQVLGKWPTLAPAALDDGDLAVTTDYRDVLAEVIAGRLGNPALEQVFPGYKAKAVGVVGR